MRLRVIIVFASLIVTFQVWSMVAPLVQVPTLVLALLASFVGTVVIWLAHFIEVRI